MYKVYIQNLSDVSKTLIYQSNTTDSLIEDPKVSFEWDQPVNFSFSIYPDHPSFSQLIPIVTFVTVESDDNEIFFGRVLTAEKDIFGKKEIYCEGALSFLSDGELSEYEGTTSVSSFFSACIAQYNQTVETRKQFSVGTVEFTDANVYFKVEDYADPKSALDEQLVKRLGGCIVIKKTGNGHSINYLKQVGEEKTNRIRIGENVKDRTDHASGESIFSVLRPTGGTNSGEDEPVTLSGNGGVIEIPAMIAKYGRITKKETFSDQFTEEGLRMAAMAFIDRLGMIDDKPPVTVDIGYVDFCYLNPSIGKIYFGDVFDDIEGYPGEAMVVGRMELDLSNPANDTLSLYNKTYLDAREYAAILSSSTGAASASGGRGGGIGGGSALAQTLADVEEEQIDVLNIGGEDIKRLNIHANATDGYITLSAHQLSLQSEVLFGSNRTYDMISTDVEEMWGSQVHADGNGFWNMYGTVVRDDSGRLVIKGDSGLAVEKTDDQGRRVTVGVYDELGLTAGLLVDKINSESTTYILGDRLIFGNAQNTYSVVRPELSDNPKALGYYELQNGSYVLTNDTERVYGKNYYIKKYSIGPGGDTVGSRMEKEASRISLVVEGYGENAHIKPAAIVTEINRQQGTSTVRLSADMIELDGKVLMGNVQSLGYALTVDNADIGRAIIRGSNGNALDCYGRIRLIDTYLSLDSDSYIYGPSASFDDIYIGGGSGFQDGVRMNTGVMSISANSESNPPNGLIGFNVVQFDGDDYDVNFNIAATQYYLNHVAAAYGNAVGRVVWPNAPRSQSSFSVSAPTNPWNAAQETGTTESRVFVLSNDGIFDDTTHITTVNLEMSHNAGGQTVLDGVVATIAIDASAVYTEGQDAAPIQGQITKTYTSNGWKSVIYPDEGYSGISAVQIHVDVPIPDPPAYSSSGWGITAAAGGGTKVELYVDGHYFSHTFNDYP